MKKLTYEETEKLVEREVLSENNVHICIHGLSKHSTDEFVITNIRKEGKNFIFEVENITDCKKYVCTQDMISEISNMSIENLLKAYDMIGETKLNEFFEETDVENDILGKDDISYCGLYLEDGMKVYFHNDKNPKYTNKILTVRITENSGIKLVANRGRPKKIR